MTARRSLVQAATGPSLPAPLGCAHALPAAVGSVLRAISGQVREPNGVGQVPFDMVMLQQLPQTSSRPARPGRAKPWAFVAIPLDEARRHDLIRARPMARDPMDVRIRGSLLVTHPFDSRPELRSLVFVNRSS